MRVQLDDARAVVQRHVRHRADGLGGADHVAHVARLDNAGAQRARHLVATAEHDHRGTGEARGLAQPGRQRAEHAVRCEDRRKARRIDVERVAGLVRPGAGADVEQHRRRRVRGIDRQHARRLEGDVGAGKQVRPARRVGLRLVLAEPGDLGRDVARIEVAAGDLAETRRVDPPRGVGALGVRAAVHPDHRGVHGLALVVDRDEAVELRGEGDRIDALGADLARHLAQRRMRVRRPTGADPARPSPRADRRGRARRRTRRGACRSGRSAGRMCPASRRRRR